eukprot:TRINITY_DN74317_c0_g1_i1.p1 TRINITY_DN74317_c0_g1~~TRINITY_DN74317_c0_g1_i1.p1  ORF type:complete len:398 (+),score=56.65 TRINITY_DN74317_c0_g1_i1:153-1346(+)
MVVAQIVKIRNNTLRSFCVTPGDYFYTASIDGKPVRDGPIEVTPGFDQVAEGLTVPWQSMSSSGLEIAEASSDASVRCLVGPVESDADGDWLQLRSASGEPVAEERWIMLGHRHLLGTIGHAAEICLTFRDTGNDPAKPSALCDIVHFDNATKSAPSNAVFLNVFDLASALSVPNAILCNTVFNTVGAFHAAIEVYGEEWAFYRTPNPTSCGVCKSLRARHHPVHVYRQSVYLGDTRLKDWEVRYLIRGKLATKWPGGTYDLLRRNCIHFCEELSLALGVSPVPSWVRGLHETGASIFQLPWPLTCIKSLVSYAFSRPRALADGNPSGEGMVDERSDAVDERSDTRSDVYTDTITSTVTRAQPAASPDARQVGDDERNKVTLPSLGTFIGSAADESA